MSLAAKMRRAPLRAVTGAFILGSGLDKLKADEDTAKQLHGFASGTYGFLGKLDPKLFAKGLGAGEVALGTAVLAPIVSPVIAGLGLAGFSAGLLNMWWNTPGMHEEGKPKPTQAGIPIAKDVWMFGIGVGLVADGVLSPAHDKKVKLAAAAHEKRNRKERRKAKKATKKARGEAREHALEIARGRQADLNKRAVNALNQAQKTDAAKRARQASERAAKRLGEARVEYAPVVLDKAKQARSSASDLYDQYAPVAADKAKQARSTASDLYDQYAPVAADKAKQARSTASDLYDQYAPVAADKAKQARSTASDLYEQYAPVAADKARQARDAAAGLRDDVNAAAAVKVKQSRRSARRTAKRTKKRAKKAAR